MQSPFDLNRNPSSILNIPRIPFIGAADRRADPIQMPIHRDQITKPVLGYVGEKQQPFFQSEHIVPAVAEVTSHSEYSGAVADNLQTYVTDLVFKGRHIEPLQRPHITVGSALVSDVSKLPPPMKPEPAESEGDRSHLYKTAWFAMGIAMAFAWYLRSTR